MSLMYLNVVAVVANFFVSRLDLIVTAKPDGSFI